MGPGPEAGTEVQVALIGEHSLGVVEIARDRAIFDYSARAGLGGAQVGTDGDVHADITCSAGKYRAQHETDGRIPTECKTEDHKHGRE